MKNNYLFKDLPDIDEKYEPIQKGGSRIGPQMPSEAGGSKPPDIGL